MSCRRSTLEELSDEVQLIVLKYLSLHDLYYSLFDLKHRYNKLIKTITPTKINMKQLDHDIDQSGVLISNFWVWNDRFLYFTVPTLQANQTNMVGWRFLTLNSFEQYAQQLDRRIVRMIQQYRVQSNAPDFLVTKANYYFCSVSDNLLHLEEWIRNNYPRQYEIIQRFGPRHHLPRRIDHHDGKHLEIKQALADVQRLERLKRKSMIYESAQQIWSELRRLTDANIIGFSYSELDQIF